MKTDKDRVEQKDYATAQAFSTSWNNLPLGSVYTNEQYLDWIRPLTDDDIRGKRILEMGCGNGSLLIHTARRMPAYLQGIDLGDSVSSARKNCEHNAPCPWAVDQADLTTFQSEGYDLVYSVGVLHHLKNPHEGFEAVVRNTLPGGRFHCWVYGKEGNGFVIGVIDPLRRLFSKFPWWFTKYIVCTPLAVPAFVYGKWVAANRDRARAWKLPLAQSDWIERNDFSFYRHVFFDQMVTPVTHYISRAEIDEWFRSHPRVDGDSTYILQRSGNSWKFGGKVVNSEASSQRLEK